MSFVPHTASLRIGKRASFVPLLNKIIPTYHYNFATYNVLEGRKRNHKLLTGSLQLESTPATIITINPPIPDLKTYVNRSGNKDLDLVRSSCRLKRNRIDKKFEEATFVSTDSIRLSGNAKFEVFDGEDLLLSGVLEMCKKSNGFVGKSKTNDGQRWSMTCESMIGANTRVLKGKQFMGCDSMPPMIEVYVAGSFSGQPVILTEALQISPRKKQTRKGVLDPIPEGDMTESQKNVASGLDLQEAEYGPYKTGNEYDYNNSMHWSQNEYMEGEDGVLTWFNAGVRVGVGLGLGICLGVGIGVVCGYAIGMSISKMHRHEDIQT
ncbi:hypothetical protein L1987_14046 [Smallanthus sonchifolius]|uniref:Uncharacterized protein n=1 Tax=Smallanthus sonchifolius TaxID=185202 RepID=A0ACB9JKI2_9ASTR|nr:hypothetical protein L1987_14046 [Smallanthus sonchifolius]